MQSVSVYRSTKRLSEESNCMRSHNWRIDPQIPSLLSSSLSSTPPTMKTPPYTQIDYCRHQHLLQPPCLHEKLEGKAVVVRDPGMECCRAWRFDTDFLYMRLLCDTDVKGWRLQSLEETIDFFMQGGALTAATTPSALPVPILPSNPFLSSSANLFLSPQIITTPPSPVAPSPPHILIIILQSHKTSFISFPSYIVPPTVQHFITLGQEFTTSNYRARTKEISFLGFFTK